MSNFLYIAEHVIMPIFLQIVAGFFIQKKFKLSTATMAKLQFYIFIPALLFTQIYNSHLESDLIVDIIGIFLILFLVLFIISYIIAKIYKFPKKQEGAFFNSICLFNSGNYCIPLINLLYKDSLLLIASAVQIVIMVTQSVLTNTFGIFNVNKEKKHFLYGLIEVFKLPMIYAILFAIFFKLLELSVYPPLMSSLGIIAQGMTPLALITLGAQLANFKLSMRIPKVYIALFLRLVISPIVAFLLVTLIGVTGVAKEVVIIVAAAPSAVNSVLLAIEYDNEPELASEIVFTSTIFSIITMSLTIYIVQNFI